MGLGGCTGAGAAFSVTGTGAYSSRNAAAWRASARKKGSQVSRNTCRQLRVHHWASVLWAPGGTLLTRAASCCKGSLSSRVGTRSCHWKNYVLDPSARLPANKWLQAPDLEGFMGQLWTAGVFPARLGHHAEIGLAWNAPLGGGAVFQQAAGCCPGWGHQPLQQFLHTASPTFFQARYTPSQKNCRQASCAHVPSQEACSIKRACRQQLQQMRRRQNATYHPRNTATSALPLANIQIPGQ